MSGLGWRPGGSTVAVAELGGEPHVAHDHWLGSGLGLIQKLDENGERTSGQRSDLSFKDVWCVEGRISPKVSGKIDDS